MRTSRLLILAIVSAVVVVPPTSTRAHCHPEPTNEIDGYCEMIGMADAQIDEVMDISFDTVEEFIADSGWILGDNQQEMASRWGAARDAWDRCRGGGFNAGVCMGRAISAFFA